MVSSILLALLDILCYGVTNVKRMIARGKTFQAAIAMLPLKEYNRVNYTSDNSRGFEVFLSDRWQQMAWNASSLCYAYFV